MAGHSHGKMDVTAQQKTFAGFIKAVTWGFVVVVAILILLTTRI